MPPEVKKRATFFWEDNTGKTWSTCFYSLTPLSEMSRDVAVNKHVVHTSETRCALTNTRRIHNYHSTNFIFLPFLHLSVWTRLKKPEQRVLLKRFCPFKPTRKPWVTFCLSCVFLVNFEWGFPFVYTIHTLMKYSYWKKKKTSHRDPTGRRGDV